MSQITRPTQEQLYPYRPVPFYFITTTDPAELSYEAALASLAQLKADGFGGIVLFNKPPHGFNAQQYLSEEWFAMVKNFVRAAAALELRVWLNDGFDFPPGSAGGRISKEKYPHLTQKRLVAQGDSWTVQEVDWGFPAFEEPESAMLFHSIVYEVYKTHVGEYFGNTIRGFFSDADNRRVTADTFREDSLQKDFFPWSSNFAQTFRQAYGYDITPHIPSILKKEGGSYTADYWQHAGALYQSWFAANYRWCKENGLEYTFHTSDSTAFAWEEAPRSSLYTEGRALDMEHNCDWPGTDQELLELNGGKHLRKEEYWTPKASWGGDDALLRNPAYRDMYSDLRPKQAESTAFLYGKKGAMCEMFAASNWGVTFNDLREIAARQIMQGINFIVPHAYHHRLRGVTKFFAPPDFSPRGHLAAGMRQFNDLLAEYCWFASQGTLQAPVAVLDVTDDIWAHRADNKLLFETCMKLDRLPYGYVIADAASIAANKEKFAVVLNAGAEPVGERAELLKASGLPVLPAAELERLSEFVPCDVCYTGDGAPHFMRRLLPDGEELVLLCSLEQAEPVSGTLYIGGTAHPVTLHSGEIACFTREGALSADVLPECAPDGVPLPSTAQVTWSAPNMLPLEFWRDGEGNAATKFADAAELNFAFTTEARLADAPRLLVPQHCAPLIETILLDEMLSGEPECVQLWDETYLSYALPDAAVPGKHTLTLHKTGPLPPEYLLYLMGGFGVRLQTEEPWHICCGIQYNLRRYIPAHAEVTLYAREQTLDTAQSWCAQGHPFYSGAAVYRFETKLPPEFGSAVLSLPAVDGICTVALDGKVVGRHIFAPVDCLLGDMGGAHVLEVTVHNTCGNMLECYQAPSGLAAGGSIHPVK